VAALMEFEFFIDGVAQPAGSKKWLPTHGKAGGRPLIVDANAKAKPWQHVCEITALAAMRKAGFYEPFSCPLFVDAFFYRQRPKGHYNAKGGLNAHGRRHPYPDVKPDRGKLLRAIEDAFSGVIYTDDNLVVGGLVEKRYGKRQGVLVRVSTPPMED
jgi:Holliday junction resolvase RusA-like endonuclease